MRSPLHLIIPRLIDNYLLYLINLVLVFPRWPQVGSSSFSFSCHRCDFLNHDSVISAYIFHRLSNEVTILDGRSICIRVYHSQTHRRCTIVENFLSVSTKHRCTDKNVDIFVWRCHVLVHLSRFALDLFHSSSSVCQLEYYDEFFN